MAVGEEKSSEVVADCEDGRCKVENYKRVALHPCTFIQECDNFLQFGANKSNLDIQIVGGDEFHH